MQVRKVFVASRGTYGYRRVHAALARRGIEVGPELVRHLMSRLGLVACQPRPWRTTTIAGVDPAPGDQLAGEFTAEAPGERFVGDITYVRTWEGWLCLATVIDLCTKEVVGWAMADHLRTELVCDAITMAHSHRRIARGAVFHSDRGCQVHLVRRPHSSGVGPGGHELAASSDAPQPVRSHQPFDLAARDQAEFGILTSGLFTSEFLEDLAGPIQAAADRGGLVHPDDVSQHDLVPGGAGRLGSVAGGVEGARSDLAPMCGQHMADRLDSEASR
ncbi:MAG: DDE-type integrase/transposase/recombinase [Acidimicrobiia bacterium]